MGRLTQHNTPGPVGRPRCNSVGHEVIASVEAGKMGRRPDTCSSQGGDAACSRPAPRCTCDSPTPGTSTCYLGA
eukprot:532348-Prymnesium_polylepis.1